MSDRLHILKTHLAGSTKDVFIVSAKRTPIGGYMGQLSSFTAPQLGALSLKGAYEQIKLNPKEIQQVIMGNVLSAGMGQAPSRQAAIKAGLDVSATCTTINKVCSSGLKSVIFGAQSIALGNSSIVAAGGFESMSNAPHAVMNARKGVGHGDKKLVDLLTHDGLTDAFQHISMGLCAQKTAKQMKITREDQDEYCKMTFSRHMEASKNGICSSQIVPVKINTKAKESIVSADEQVKRYKQQAVSKLKPSFDKNGTVTVANASKINDGACSIILMSEEKLKSTSTKPLAKIIAYADHQMLSLDFCVSPFYATQKAIQKAGLKIEDIDFFQFNEAFSVVPIAMMKMMKVPKEKVNVFGGAVAMGHPIGASGARILQSLLTVMRVKGGKYGLAGICNGGGGSTALIIQNLQ